MHRYQTLPSTKLEKISYSICLEKYLLIFQQFFLSQFYSNAIKYKSNHNYDNAFLSKSQFKIYLKGFQMTEKNLTIPEKQAYQGAKSFYYCFMPCCIIGLLIIDSYRGLQNKLLDLFIVLLYFISEKFYKLCHTIDTYEHQLGQTYQNEQLNDENNSSIARQIESETQLKEKQQILQDEQLRSSSGARPEKYFCKFCKIKLPYRSRHCFKCRRCVKRYDHHCFWIGNCVGASNHRQFYFFLFLQTAHNISMEESIRSNLYLVENMNLFIKILSYSMWIFSIGFIMFTSYLFLYHSMLIATGQTTWQHLRRKSISYLKYLPAGFNPFSKGVFKNFSNFMKKSLQSEKYEIPSYQQAKKIQPSCSLIDNEYYSCC